MHRAQTLKRGCVAGMRVPVAGARNPAESVLIQDLLLGEGVSSLLRRSACLVVPDFMAACPRDVLVPQSGEPAAREVLLQAELITPGRRSAAIAPGRLLAGILVALAIGLLVIWLVVALIGH